MEATGSQEGSFTVLRASLLGMQTSILPEAVGNVSSVAFVFLSKLPADRLLG